jgi:hypothetical protein
VGQQFKRPGNLNPNLHQIALLPKEVIRSNQLTQLGIGSRTPFSPTPVQISIPNGDKVNQSARAPNFQPQNTNTSPNLQAVAVAAGTDFSLVLTDSGRVFSCGDDMFVCVMCDV